jgi:hypothetical protein
LTGLLDSPLSENISEALRKSRSITSLYSHQAEAINALHSGKHVIGEDLLRDYSFINNPAISVYQHSFWQECNLPSIFRHFRNPVLLYLLLQQAPMLKFLEEDNSATAMLIYPTKVRKLSFGLCCCK